MTVETTEITAHLAELSDSSFDAFCEDIGGMFGVEMTCTRRQTGTDTVKSLRKHFKKLTAVHLVKADGFLDGTFHLFFDQGGLFVLSGVIVMLPPPRILEEVKLGSITDAENLEDAAREVGNLLVGSWDRVFREECEGHEHFVKKSTYVGKPYEALEKVELSAEDKVAFVLYEMTIESYPTFTCAVLFSNDILSGGSSTETAPPEEPVAEPKPIAAEPKEPETKAAPATSNDSTTAAEESPSPQDTTSGETDPEPPQVVQEVKATEPPVSAVSTPSEVPIEKTDGAVTEPPDDGDDRATDDFSDVTSDRGFYGGSEPIFLDPSYVQAEPFVPDSALSDLLRISAAEIMQKNVVWCGPDETVQDVITKMQQHGTGYVLVGQNGVLEGLISGSNVLGAVSLYLRPMFAKWRRPEDDATLNVKVKWIMSRPVRTVGPKTSLAQIMESMCRHGGHCLPVVDGKGGVQGIVTSSDVFLKVLNADGAFSWHGSVPQVPSLLQL